MSYSVYIHTCPDGKRYIGITGIDPQKRWRNGEGYKSQYFYEAIKEFGWSAIQHEIVSNGLSLEDAQVMEKKLIRQYKSDNSLYGYNVTAGGAGASESPIILEGFIGDHLDNPLVKDSDYLSWAYEDRGNVWFKIYDNGNESVFLYIIKDEYEPIKNSPIYQYDLKGNFIAEWDTYLDASRYAYIRPVLVDGILKSLKYNEPYGKYIWSYDPPKPDAISTETE